MMNLVPLNWDDKYYNGELPVSAGYCETVGQNVCTARYMEAGWGIQRRQRGYIEDYSDDWYLNTKKIMKR